MGASFLLASGIAAPQVLRVFLRFLAALCLVTGWGGVGQPCAVVSGSPGLLRPACSIVADQRGWPLHSTSCLCLCRFCGRVGGQLYATSWKRSRGLSGYP